MSQVRVLVDGFQNSRMQQKRLLLALLISTAILFLWGYLFPAKLPDPPKPSEAPASASPSVGPSIQATQPASPSELGTNVSFAQEPSRILVVKTPLYEAKFDSRGAEVVSWIIKKNKDSQQDIYSVGGTKTSPMPLELVSAESLKRVPRDVPLQLSTGDPSLDAILSASTYRIEEEQSSRENAEIVLAANEKKTVTFALQDGGGLQVIKKITFDGDRYTTDLEVTIKRGEEVVPQAKLKIGPSIGDQGIRHYTFYSVAPEGIASLKKDASQPGEIVRHSASSINENTQSPDRLSAPGLVDWAGIGDTYFAMVAIPSKIAEGLEFHTTAYEFKANDGKVEKRYLINAWVPIPADGSRTALYTGPKDHFILTGQGERVRENVGRDVDLEGLIDYGWFTWLSRPLAVPILKAIKWLRNLTGSYGVAIILFTIVIYSLFFPLKWRSSKAMKKAQKLAPRMKELQEKIKGMKQSDPRLKELQMEQLRLMKEGNPLGGCLPLLIQMPFLFALYRAITISLDFRQASFLWLPDLSAGDPFHILEILMSGTMIILQLITPAPSADPLQRKMMAIGMPLFMLYVLWGAPSGLLVYWLVGNIVGFSQQFLINHLTKSDDEVQPPTERRPENGRKRKVATSTA